MPARTVVVATADATLRGALAEALRAARWQVREAEGGAALFAMASEVPAAILVDSWLPDLDVRECVREWAAMYPETDLLALDGTDLGVPATAHRGELLHLIRGAASGGAGEREPDASRPVGSGTGAAKLRMGHAGPEGAPKPVAARKEEAGPLPELLGSSPKMLEVSRRIRLVAPRRTPVLIQGPTGTGKELVARAIHRLSSRAGKPFCALNCAAIPEALLEAELFGHTRGAFTGAMQSRVGRLEAAHGGTVFLDEIGELPLALQAKLLRFAECGELQRMGENEPVRVDVRIVAATHRKLRAMAEAGQFRADLYYRLSVFLIETPALVGRASDIELLAGDALLRLSVAAGESPKRLSPQALERLVEHSWPGNVRELQHTLERASILAGDNEQIEAGDIDFGSDGAL